MSWSQSSRGNFRLDVSLHALLQILSLTLFEKLPLKQAVSGVDPVANNPTLRIERTRCAGIAARLLREGY
jgi:hypothetical protein